MDLTDAGTLATTPERETALRCLRAAVESAHPDTVTRDAIRLDGDTLRIDGATYDLDDYDEVAVVGGGKATGGVADALEAVLGDRITRGAVVTTDPDPDAAGTVERLRGDHPVPSERGADGARRVLDLAESAGERTLVVAVVTGGASALLPAPTGGVSLSALRETTEALLEAGADIDEINAVRKHLSALKGGGLARAAAPATVVTLAFSDVVGDDLSVIGSGPTAPDESTFADALAVVERYDLSLPGAVVDRLERGAAGDLPETPGPDDPLFDRVRHVVLAGSFTALAGARDAARERGYRTCLLSSRVRGEAREAARTGVAVVEEVRATGNPVEPPAVVLSGGECTVTVGGDGEGGPNLEYALAAALELPPGSAVAAADSDGRDGGTDVAGALVDAATVDDRLAARAALADNDSLPYLSDRGAVLDTGPTGTNVNDVRIHVVGHPGDGDAEEGDGDGNDGAGSGDERAD
jgi:hydroxypyruvate reductase